MTRIAVIFLSVLLPTSWVGAATVIKDQHVHLRFDGDWVHSVRGSEDLRFHTLKSAARDIEINFSLQPAPKVRADNLELAANRLHEAGRKNWPVAFAQEGRSLRSFSSALAGDDSGWTSTHYGLDSTDEHFRATTHVRVGKILNVFANSPESGQSELQEVTDRILAGLRP